MPASSKWTAKAWRRLCGVTGLDSPERRCALWQASPTVSRVIGWPGTSPGKSHAWVARPANSAQDLEQRGGEHHVAVFLSFTLHHAKHHALAVDSLGFSRMASEMRKPAP